MDGEGVATGGLPIAAAASAALAVATHVREHPLKLVRKGNVPGEDFVVLGLQMTDALVLCLELTDPRMQAAMLVAQRGALAFQSGDRRVHRGERCARARGLLVEAVESAANGV